MSDTQKHEDFVSEPMRDKSVIKIPGIGPAAAGHMTRMGYSKAYKVLGQFLVLEKNEEKFCDWLMGVSGGNAGNKKACYNALKIFCEIHV